MDLKRDRWVVVVAMGCLLTLVAGAFALAISLVPPLDTRTFGVAQVSYRHLNGWTSDLHGQALEVLRRSCVVLGRKPPTQPMGPNAFAGHVGDWREPCAASKFIDSRDHEASRQFFETWFEPFLVSANGDNTGLFTGYYEPTLSGSLMSSAEYRTPLFARPQDLVTVKLGEFSREWIGETISGQIIDGKLRPYATRAEIMAGALGGKGLELVWVNDPIDAFFLHIQGSGQIVLPDGQIVRLGYASQNGHPYTSIGRELVREGVLSREAVTMQSIRAWLRSNPDLGREMINRNASFVFFRINDRDGPIGAQNVVLTPERSLAVDRRFVPLGVPLWLETKAPTAKGEDKIWHRLMVAQDTGGAIRGPVRGDVFWGAGAEAAEVAGRMKHSGRYYILLPRALSHNL